MNRPQIVICLSEGIVQYVYAPSAEAKVILIDWDVDNHDEDRPEIVKFKHHGRAKRALVMALVPEPPAKLAGSDLEAAIKAAERVGIITQPVVEKA